METARRGGIFYRGMALALLVLVFAGFSPAVMERFRSGGSMSAVLMVHSVSYLAWYALFATQAWLTAGRNLIRHQALGRLSLYLAAIMVLSSIGVGHAVFTEGRNAGTGLTPEHFIILPIMDGLLFIVYYALAYQNRRQSETHKHLMLLASIMIMDPATGRLGFALGNPAIGLLLHFGLLAALWVHDYRTQRRIHPTSLIAVAVLAGRYAAFFLVGPSDGWAQFVHTLFG